MFLFSSCIDENKDGTVAAPVWRMKMTTRIQEAMAGAGILVFTLSTILLSGVGDALLGF